MSKDKLIKTLLKRVEALEKLIKNNGISYTESSDEKAMGGSIAIGATQGAVMGAGIAPPYGAIVGGVAGGIKGIFDEKAVQAEENAAIKQDQANKINQMNAEEGFNTRATIDTEFLDKAKKDATLANNLLNLAGTAASAYSNVAGAGTSIPMAEGGNLTEFKGYSHELGGIPLPDSNNEVEDKETSYKGFIFSERLKIPGKNKSFAQESKRIKKQYGQRTDDPYDQQAMEEELAELAHLQEKLKEQNNDIEPEVSQDILDSVSYAKGGQIYIKPERRGLFTREAKRRGMGVQEFAHQVLANKERYSKQLIKRAVFAANMAKIHKAAGGPLGVEGEEETVKRTKTLPGGTTPEQRLVNLLNSRGKNIELTKINGRFALIENGDIIKEAHDINTLVNILRNKEVLDKENYEYVLGIANEKTKKKIEENMVKPTSVKTEISDEAKGKSDLEEKTFIEHLNEKKTVTGQQTNQALTGITGKTTEGKKLLALAPEDAKLYSSAVDTAGNIQAKLLEKLGKTKEDITKDFYLEPEDLNKYLTPEEIQKYYQSIKIINDVYTGFFGKPFELYGDIEGQLPLEKQKIGIKHLTHNYEITKQAADQITREQAAKLKGLNTPEPKYMGGKLKYAPGGALTFDSYGNIIDDINQKVGQYTTENPSTDQLVNLITQFYGVNSPATTPSQDINTENYETAPSSEDTTTSQKEVNDNTSSNVNLNKLTKGDIAGLVANNLGNIYNIVRGVSGAEQYTPEQLTPNYLDYSSTLGITEKSFDDTAIAQRENVRRNATTSGQALAALTSGNVALAQNKADTLAKIKEQEINANTQLKNTYDQSNLNLRNQAQLINQQNQVAANQFLAQGISGIGSSLAQFRRDKKLDQRDQTILNNLSTEDLFVVNTKNGPKPAYRNENGEIVIIEN